MHSLCDARNGPRALRSVAIDPCLDQVDRREVALVVGGKQCAVRTVDDGVLRRVVEPGIHGPILELARALIDHASVPWVAMLGFENRCGKAAQSTRSDGVVSERGKRSHFNLVFGIDWVLMYGAVDQNVLRF